MAEKGGGGGHNGEASGSLLYAAFGSGFLKESVGQAHGAPPPPPDLLLSAYLRVKGTSCPKAAFPIHGLSVILKNTSCFLRIVNQ